MGSMLEVQRFLDIVPHGACGGSNCASHDGSSHRAADSRADGAAAQGTLLARWHPGTPRGEGEHQQP